MHALPSTARLLPGALFALAFALAGCGARPADAERGPSPSAVRPYTAAGLMAQAGDDAEAARLYDDAAAADPGSTEIWLAASRTRSRLGEHDAAVERARKAVALAPDSTRVVDALGRALVAAERLDEAGKVYDDLLKSGPEDGVAHAGLGALSVRRGDGEAAERHYARAVELDPDRAAWWAALGEVRLAREKPGPAAVAFDRAAELDVARRKLDPRVMMMALQAGDRRTARKVADRIAGDEAPPGAGSLAIAGLLARRGDNQQAVDELTWLLNRHPDHAGARYMLAGTLLQLDRHDDARKELERVPAGTREWPDALRMRAALVVESDPSLAASLLGQARSAGGSRPDVIRQLAGALHRGGRLPEARSELMLAVAEWPDDPPLRYMLALIVHEMDGEDAALPEMMRVVELDPDHPGALNYIGYTFAERGERLEEAEAMIRRALKKRPDDGAITDSLGWVLFRQGHFERAVEVLTEAARLSPDVGEIHYHLARALAAAGRKGEARKAFEAAIQHARDDEERAMFEKAKRALR